MIRRAAIRFVAWATFLALAAAVNPALGTFFMPGVGPRGGLAFLLTRRGIPRKKQESAASPRKPQEITDER